ncbi:MAG: lysophospholipid acyltransferase family protein [Burkholderiales bacterium]
MFANPAKALLPLYDYLVVYLGLLWLGILCLVYSVLTVALYVFLPRGWGRRIGRIAIMLMFRLFLFSLSLSRRCHFDLAALDSLRDDPAMIIAPNHPSLLDAVLIISRLPNVACVLKTGLMNNIFLGAGARLAGYIRSEPLRKMILLARQNLSNGSHLLLFPEGTRTVTCPVNPLKGSISLIAHQSQAAVQTILIETDTRYLSKGWKLFSKPPLPIHYRLRLGKRFDAPDSKQDFMTKLDYYFAHELVHGSPFYPTNRLPPVLPPVNV